MSQDLNENLKNKDHWLKALMIVVLAIIFWLATLVLGFTVLLGLIWLLVTGSRLENLSKLGKQLGNYMKQIIDYATLNSEDKPFPFSDWPDSEPESAAAPVAEEQAVAASAEEAAEETPEPPPAPKPKKKAASKKKATRKKKTTAKKPAADSE